MNFNHVQQVRRLYKVILKLNRSLPPSLMELGNSYVKEEFKRHKKCNEQQAKIFITEWTCYAIDLSHQLGIKGIKQGFRSIGNSLSEDELNKFNDDQILQLYELLITVKSKDMWYEWNLFLKVIGILLGINVGCITFGLFV